METKEVRVCIICTKSKSHSEFNIEHVFPSAIGGAITINSVCKTCNSDLGRLIDQPFLSHGMIAYYRNIFQLSRNDSRRKQNIPSPFKIPIVNINGKQFKMGFKDKKPMMEIVEELAFSDDPATGELVAKLTIPGTKINETDAILKKLAKRQGYEIIDYRIGSEEITPYPAIKTEILTDNNIFIRGCLKIAYEALIYFFPKFIDDEICNLIRLSLTAPEINSIYSDLIQSHHKDLMERYHAIIPNIPGISVQHHAFLIENVDGVGIVCCVKIFNWFYPIILSRTTLPIPPNCCILVCNHSLARSFESNLTHRYVNIRLDVELAGVSEDLQLAIANNGERRFHSANGTLHIYGSDGKVKYEDSMKFILSIMNDATRYFPWHASGFNIDVSRQNLYVKDLSGKSVRLRNIKTDREVIFQPIT